MMLSYSRHERTDVLRRPALQKAGFFFGTIEDMFGILLATLGGGFDEISNSIGKRTVAAHRASLYTFGFLDLFLGAVLLIGIGVLHDSFVFSMASLPTFIPRLFLEILQAHMMIVAVVRTDRGNFGIVRSLTIPLLLLIDLSLGYSLTSSQTIGMGLILLSVFLLFSTGWRRSDHLPLLLATAINASVTISLYKYDITYFNSVEAEQGIIMSAIMIYFFALAYYSARENPLRLLKRPLLAGLSLSSACTQVLVSFAYLFAPASIILAAYRASTVLFSIISGRYVFKEKHFALRIILCLLIIAGLILLTR